MHCFIRFAEYMGAGAAKDHRKMKLPFFLSLMLAICATLFSGSAYSDIFTVTTADDSGVESLRGRIEAANLLAGPHTINFNIPGGPHLIVLISPLPPIMESVLIDGYDAPGAEENSLENGSDAVLMIGISGENGIDTGLDLQAGNSTVRGLAIFNFVNQGIKISGGGSNTISGNFIGLGLGGTANLPSDIGIEVGSGENVIGGSNPSDRNAIWAYKTAVWVRGDNNDIMGNYIGSRADGGPIFGELYRGVHINNLAATVLGTEIGAPGDGNLIVGSKFGISIDGAEGTRIRSNTIGRQSQGNARGINARSGTDTRIGGSLEGESNTISFNRNSGVIIQAFRQGHTITRNAIHHNGKLGIDLGTNMGNRIEGVTENDLQDADDFPGNDGQNFPIVTTAVRNKTDIQVSGTLLSLPEEDFIIEFFANTELEPADDENHHHGEGEFYLGSLPVKTNGSGEASFTSFALPLSEGFCISATATHIDTGNTSEFSPCEPMYGQTCTVKEATDAEFRGALDSCASDLSDGVVNIVDFAEGITEINKTGPSFQANGVVEIRGDCDVTITAEDSLDPILTLNELAFSVGVNVVAPAAIPPVPGVFIAGPGSHFSNCNAEGDPPIVLVGDHNVVQNVNMTTPGFSACDNVGDWNYYSGCSANGPCNFEGNDTTVENCTFNGGTPPRIANSTEDGRGPPPPFGIAVISGEGNSISRTVLHNTTVPIDLFPIGNTVNDKGDGDEGTNHLNNAPVLHTSEPARTESRGGSPTATRVHGLLDSTPDTEFIIEVFTNNSGCLPGSYGAADAYFGSFLVNTDSNGIGAFDVQFEFPTNPGEHILATATDSLGNTSEFSTCQVPESIFSIELDFEHGFEDPP